MDVHEIPFNLTLNNNIYIATCMLAFAVSLLYSDKRVFNITHKCDRIQLEKREMI